MFPTPFTVEHAAASATGENALGQVIVTDLVTRQRPVYGWENISAGDGNSAELAGRITTDLWLLTPDGDWSDGDTVTIPGRGPFIIHGDPEDCNGGPFGFAPGYRVRLRKVTDGPA